MSDDTTKQATHGVGSDALLCVWLLLGGYDYEGETVIACCATKVEAEYLKQYGEENKTWYGSLRYGYDSLMIQEWRVGERADGLPPNVQSEPRGSNQSKT